MTLRLRLSLCVTVAAFCFAVLSATAFANTPITSFSAIPSTAQAGGHPDIEIHFTVENRILQVSHSICDCEDAKDAEVHLPAGLIGNPHATPQCTIAEFSADTCPIDSQVGIARVEATGISFISMIYNVVPPPDAAGLLAFKVFLWDTPQFTLLSSRTGGDYGLDATAISIYHGTFPLSSLQQILWGVPADPSHDALRLNPADNPNVPGTTYYGGDELCDANGTPSTNDPRTVDKPCYYTIPPVASNSPLTPFLQNPTNCDGPLSASLRVVSYDGGSDTAETSWPQQTGCDQLSFNPSLYAQPTTKETDTASGIDVNLTVPQQLSPEIPSPSELRDATITLPPGFSINPNAADGKTACTDAEANFGTLLAAQCPEYSKVGSLEIDSSALPGPLPGFVYLGQPLPANRYRIFLIADGFNTHIKLPGTVTPNPVTGQLTISFQELPQSPLTAFNMHFFGSERGLLATPTQCGTYPVASTFTPWDSSIGSRTSAQYFTLESGPNGTPCPGQQRPFTPHFEASSEGNTAGAHNPFWIDLTRNDGDQNLTALNVTTPPGFTATLAGIPYCSDSAIQAAANPEYSGRTEETQPSCPVASQVGTATAGAGAGNHPLYVSGKVYLAGPYKGAPLSFVVITPALSGPYDLGNVVVRVALYVDPWDAHISAMSDPLPQILDGIPLRLREIQLDLSRPNFTLDPTNCAPFSVTAQAYGDQGAVADLHDFFQMANCSALPFTPKLSLGLSGGTARTQNPTLHAELVANPGNANVSKTVVALPKSEIIDNAHINDPCTKQQFAQNACPPKSVIGVARAETPLLGQPLEGPVYFMSGFGHKLPDIVAALKGQIDINLDGRIDTVNGRLRTTFEGVPDAPVKDFTLSLEGGAKGLLVNRENICSASQDALVTLVGQNGKSVHQKLHLKTPCGASHRPKRRSHRSNGSS